MLMAMDVLFIFSHRQFRVGWHACVGVSVMFRVKIKVRIKVREGVKVKGISG